MAVKKKPRSPHRKIPKSPARSWLRLARLRAEKADLKEARVAYRLAFRCAEKKGDRFAALEALSGELRMANEAMEASEIRRIESQIAAQESARDLGQESENTLQVPPEVWHVRAVLARNRGRFRLSQRCFRKFIEGVDRLRSLPEEQLPPGAVGMDWEYEWRKGAVSLITLLTHRGMNTRAAAMANWALNSLGMERYPSLSGLLHLVLSQTAIVERRYSDAETHIQTADQLFLSEHNWMYHIHALLRRAKLARTLGEFEKAQWYLETLTRICVGPEFARLKMEVEQERRSLDQEAIDLFVDSRHGLIGTRENKEIAIGKQFVLLHILEALTSAHERTGSDAERGLSKAEIIRAVWAEKYRPESHDNKLYYNINRLRNLIEPDVKNPKYLLNWREGYRLAPELKVQFIGAAKGINSGAGKGIPVGAVNEVVQEVVEEAIEGAVNQRAQKKSELPARITRGNTR
jgi:DNA-binding winged helix-turn-helix (wHTH) protein